LQIILVGPDVCGLLAEQCGAAAPDIVSESGPKSAILQVERQMFTSHNSKDGEWDGQVRYVPLR
jgi:hypothetical protein